MVFQKALRKNLELHGNRIAITYGEDEVTYNSLLKGANTVALFLIKQKLAKGTVVGVYSKNRCDIIQLVIGIMNAGCVFVLLDPALPPGRIMNMVNDLDLGVLIAGDGTDVSLMTENVDLIVRYKDILSNNVDTTEKAVQEVEEVLDAADGEDSLYIYFTSGSTGVPKGIVGKNCSLKQFIDWEIKALHIPPGFRFSQFISPYFDAFLRDIFVPLMAGGTICIPPDEADFLIAQKVIPWLESKRINLIHCVPSVFRVINDKVLTPDSLNSLQYVLMSGEKINPLELKSWYSLFNSRIQLINLYGVTETTMIRSFYRIEPDDVDRSRIPIGTPIDDTQLLILDKDLKSCNTLVPGELYIVSRYVTKGYLNDPELTHKKFVSMNVTGDGETIAFKTGDIARKLANGKIELIGREDRQVKMRGIRVELDEIESLMVKTGLLRNAVVILHGDDDNNNEVLVAYLIKREADKPDDVLVTDITNQLRRVLPDYMIPVKMIVLDSYPLLSNGKVNYKGLIDLLDQERKIIAPANKIEEKVLIMWKGILGDKPISTDDNFHQIGGNSLSTMRLIGSINKEYGVRISLNEFFKAPTIKAISATLQAVTKDPDALPEIVIDSVHRYDPFALTDVQQAYWIGRKNVFEFGNVGTHSYSEIYVEALDINWFEKVLQKLIQRHDMLRMIVTRDGQQKVLAAVKDYEVKVLDLRKYPQDEGELLFYQQREYMAHQVFSGEEWPLFDIRVTIFRDCTYKIHFSMDALVFDGGSAILFSEEFLKLYYDSSAVLEPITITFRDYVAAEHKLREGNLYNRSKRYWLDRMQSLPLAPELTLTAPEHRLEKQNFERRYSGLPPEEWGKLQQRAKRLGVTPTVLLIGCFAEVLKAWSKSAHFTLNLTLFNRIPFHPDVEKLVGDFTSLTLLEIDFRVSEAFSSRLRALQKRLWSDLEFKYFSGIEVLREMSRHHGYGVIMPIVVTSTLGLIDGNATAVVDDVENPDPMKRVYSISQTPQVWIDFQIREDRSGLRYNWDSIEGLFPKGMVDSMFSAYEVLLKVIAEDEDMLDRELPVQLPASQQTIRTKYNSTEGFVPTGLLHEAFRNQVNKRGDAIAIETRSSQFSYAQLDQMSNTLGRRLRERGAGVNTLVGIVMEKCWEQVVAALGILYSGAAYLPIDATLPEDRIHLLLEQGEADIILTTPEIKKQVEFPPGKQVLVIDKTLMDDSGGPALEFVQHNTDLAYVIFTSGSTGIPKGVKIDHRGALNTVIDINDRFGVNENDSVLALSSLSFDLSVYDIFGVLAAGGRIVIVRQDELRSPEQWYYYLHTHRVSIWNTVPALMQMLVNYSTDFPGLRLRLIMLSGDWIPVDLPDKVRELGKDISLVSLGGATEASIWSIYYPIVEMNKQWKSIPYGYPLRNQRFYVLHSDLSPSPDYVPGELYIGGIGLAQGYWKDAEKTDRSFIVDPRSGERLYRTGDLGRFLPEGVIEFLGREDSQVKIQGYRIELGEIEEAIKLHAGVDDAVVIAEDAGDKTKRLVAYVVAKSHLAGPEESVGIVNSHEEGIITDPTERKIFKLARHGIRKNGDCMRVKLLRPALDQPLHLYKRDDKHYTFKSECMSFSDFSALFESLRQHDHPDLVLPKFYYPSAGSLYPVQSYVWIKDGAVSDVEGGHYYYNPSIHTLELIHAGGVSEKITGKNVAPVKLYLVGDKRAISPLYGKLAEDFCYIEAGHISNLLVNMSGKGRGWMLDNIGDESEIQLGFSLGSDHITLQCLSGGVVATRDTAHDVSFPLTIGSNGHSIWRELPPFQDQKAISISYLSRKSYRSYLREAVPLTALSALLKSAVITSRATLFSLQELSLYLYVKQGRVEGLVGGYYKYDPLGHKLCLIDESESAANEFSGNDALYKTSGFGLFIAGRPGHQSSYLGGYLAQSMMNISPTLMIGLCPIGQIDQQHIKKALHLHTDIQIIYSIVGGLIAQAQINSIEHYTPLDTGNAENQVREHLRKLLPEYMIPRQLVSISEIPLTSNGKVDRKALLLADQTLASEKFVSAATEKEAALIKIWAKVLQLEESKISVTSSFFELGGHSIKAIELGNKIDETLNFKIPLEEVFRNHSIRQQAEYIEANEWLNMGNRNVARPDKLEVAL